MLKCSENEVDKLVEILKEDKVVCIPTDTIYGLCARVNSPVAYDNLVKIKNRPEGKFFSIMCADKAQIKEVADVGEKEEKLINAFMPGPITLILNKKKDIKINNKVGEEISSIGVRLAPTKTIKSLIKMLGCPILLTSANISGEKVCTNINQIENTFKDLDAILLGTPANSEASTIVDCSKEQISIIRKGPITKEKINEVLK